MSKKLRTIALVGLVLIALMNTLYTNFFETKDKRNNGEIEMEAPQQAVNESYQLIEEPRLDEHHNHNHDHHDHEHGEEQPDIHSVNKKAPDFELKNLKGETIKLSDLRGKKVFINFWATWCPPCKDEMPEIQQFYEEQKDDNVVILAINATDLENGNNDVVQFAEGLNLTFPILLDQTGEVSINYEVLTIPTSVIIDEQGMIIEQIIGPVTNTLLQEKLGS